MALKSPGLPDKISSSEVNALKTNNAVEHNVNWVLERFKCFYSTFAENLLKLLPKAYTNRYSIKTVIK